MQKILIIQTAFIGDVILSTPLIEAIHKQFPKSKTDFLLRKGNEGLLLNHPSLNQLLIWDKQDKYNDLKRLLKLIRQYQYDVVINCQRFYATGLLTAFSKAPLKIGFNKNPMSFMFSHKMKHEIGVNGNNIHEIDRNLQLLDPVFKAERIKPALYPSQQDFEKMQQDSPYVCMAPASVWFTKQLPVEKWIELIQKVNSKYKVLLLGGPADSELCSFIQEKVQGQKPENLAGKLSFLESAALMKHAKMNYVNDSAPLHMASAMNAPVTAFFCSTVPAFGFGPLSDNSIILETKHRLKCRPCGLHGKRECPKGHFRCGEIEFSDNIDLTD